MMLLTIRFLGFWSHSRPLRLAFRIFLGLAVAVMLLGAFGPLVVAIPVASAVGTLLLPLILAAGASSLRRGSRTARYFIIVWGLFLFGVSITWAGTVWSSQPSRRLGPDRPVACAASEAVKKLVVDGRTRGFP